MTAKRKTTSSTSGTALDRVNAYARAVLSGEEIAGPHVRNACRRHFDDLDRGAARGLWWDDAAAVRVFRFFEERLKLSEGQFEGTPFRLHPSQAFKLGSLFGWKNASGNRRFRRAYIEEGKGNGKSPFAGGVGLYGMMADSEPGAQIYAAAATKDQANILFRDAVKMRNQSPALRDRTKPSGGPGKEYNLAYHAKNSFFRPLSKEAGKTGSGLRPHFALCDEVHEHPDRSVMEMLERGFKFRRQPLLLMITNSGSDRNSVCWEEHEHAVRVAAGTREPDDDFAYVGEVIDDSTFAYVCSLDKDDDPLEDSSCWKKANPLLGTILTEEYLAGVVHQAKVIPGKLNGILRLHFCVWTDADKAWMPRATVEKVMEDFDPSIHYGAPLYMGIDLSGTKDMTVAACVVPTGNVDVKRDDGSVAHLPTYDAWVEAWTPGQTLMARAQADKQPYDLWVRDGYLNTTDGPRVRFDVVAARVAEIDSLYDVASIAYDNYAYARFSEELDIFGVNAEQLPHPQGGKVRARPSEEKIAAAKAAGEKVPLGLWMPGSVTELENLIVDGRIRLRASPVLMSALMGATFDRDAHDNRWFVKSKASVRIDAAVALAMACGAASDGATVVQPVMSPWDDPDFKLVA
ncbi:terminase large subunit [Consotaella salsifontis]|uniref:Phage terminase-like protein, large subunit, contains N-terminal HTH domain n=1 Tax=Consotaella salsifontis TaxID=1365950 RepID=A0A1T4SSE4_9HYPH|nr:terminase large subunit [Consotaella salsifontis]SKA31062.1 Phage terminase-like protein, large subunit, contains N-terminal HTH domain [Consotaella salsifontis]